jgi:para-nitrobenzyl esterase
MVQKLIFAVVLLFGFSSCVQKKDALTEKQNIVKTDKGLVSGSVSNGIAVFLGIPFAKPPVGELRWKAPQPAEPWADTLACTKFGNSPMQNDPKPFMMWTQEFITPAGSLSEDCLYLNIWTPASSAKKKLPVLVWIYGGGFTSGSGACPIYDGEDLAQEGIVYVNFNYRVGIFGFLAHPELTAESGSSSSGNYGLMDQIAALNWVKNNIEAFGGDPEKITIAGQSAGSMSVQSLVASPLAKGLFRAAIAQSGALTGRPGISLSDAEKSGLALSEKSGRNIESLRKLSADSVLLLGSSLPYGTFSPITDGYVLPGDAKQIFEDHQQNDIAVMTGWVTGDADLVLRDLQTSAAFKAQAKARYGSDSERFHRLFPSDSEENSKASQRKLAVLKFAGFPGYQWALSNKSKTYLYEFSYVPTDKPGFPNYGAFHSAEIAYALHTLKLWDRPWTQADYDVEKYMSAYWINFVKNSDPNGDNLPEWKNYNREDGDIMEFGNDPVLKSTMFQQELRFLEGKQN